jgi:DNA-binding cell septation regulator SpoVG
MTNQEQILNIFQDFKTYSTGSGSSRDSLCKRYNNHPLLLSLLSNQDGINEIYLKGIVDEMSNIYQEYSGRKLESEEWENILDTAKNISGKWNDNKWCRDVLVVIISILGEEDKGRKEHGKTDYMQPQEEQVKEPELSFPMSDNKEQKWDIQADMRLSNQEDVWAYGMVTIDNCIKFPVQLRKYKDENSGKEKRFLSYPRREVRGKWEDVVHPGPELHNEILKTVGDALKQEITKDIHLPDVEVVSVTPINPKNVAGAKAVICGLATVKISGLTIQGITIKQGEKGLFINMPQYQNAGAYKDIVYGTTKAMQQKLEDAILHLYKSKVKSTTPPKFVSKVI